MTTEYSAVARAAVRSTICHSCIALAGLRQRGQLVVPLILQALRACRCRFDCYVARDSGYITIAFMSDAVDRRSAARCRNTIVRQNDTFLQISPTWAAPRQLGHIAVSAFRSASARAHA